MTRGARHRILVTVSGQDGPGISARLFGALAEQGVEVDDVEQVRVHGRLLLCVEADMVPRRGGAAARRCWRSASARPAWRCTVEPLVEAATTRSPRQRSW